LQVDKLGTSIPDENIYILVMPKTLLLLRHGEAEKHSEAGDHARELTDIGEAQAHIVGEYLKKCKYTLDLLLSSDANRAMSTSEIVVEASELTPDCYTDESLYKITSSELVDFISTIQDSFESTLIVGHNPAITAVMNELLINNHPLLTKALNYDITAKLVVIEIMADSWEAVSLSKCVIKDVFYPDIH